MKTRYFISFFVLAAICCIGLFYNPEQVLATLSNVNPADIAWVLTAAGLVLLMTPGLSFFYGGMVGKNTISNLEVRAKNKSNLDDTLDVFPCHCIGGISGMILTGVFAKDVGLYYGHTTTFYYHKVALVIVSVYTFVGSYILYKIIDKIVPLRVSLQNEIDRLDFTLHGETYKLKKNNC